jgi:C1A family cysteine protease
VGGKSVAVAGENDVAKRAGQGRFGYVAYGTAQNGVRVTLNDDGFQLKTRNLDFTNHAAFDEKSRRFFDGDIFEF